MTIDGTRPEAKQLMDLVREGHPTASRRWFGRRPEEEPLGKDLTPLRTTEYTEEALDRRAGEEGRTGDAYLGRRSGKVRALPYWPS